MATAVIIGSAPAAAGAALALSSHPDIQITVLDLDVRLEPDKQHVLDRLSVLDPEDWPEVEVGSVVGQLVGPLCGVCRRNAASDPTFHSAMSVNSRV